jgi:hypothetical protein
MKRFTRRTALVTGMALLATACATRPELSLSDEAWPGLETLPAVTAGREGLTVRVASKGCATRADFVFRVDRSNGRAVVAFARRRLETCRIGEAGFVDLTFSYAELGLRRGERIVVANPVRLVP